MAFKREDQYAASGSTKLWNAWTPYVSKFDTSSFYNWEQDNLPLYDLEERTYEAWEQLGFPTSSVPGMALTVSADAGNTVEGQAQLLAESTLFTDVSSAIAAIPKVVRFPVLVEVGSFGDLGNMELHNFRIEEGGSIEIINRNASKFYSASSTVNNVAAGSVYNSSHDLIKRVDSLDLSNTFTNASCVHLGLSLLSGTDDSRFGTGYAFAHPQHTLRRGTVAFGYSVGTLDGNIFDWSLYENTAGGATYNDDTLPSYDTSTYDALNNDYPTRGQVDSSDSVKGVVYNNVARKISIKNCDGPIYIRGFVVDGNITSVDDGISVINSDVVLENCAAMRCNEAGFKFHNSKVTLSRTACSYRNYKLTDSATRAEETGVGFHAVNSEVTVSALLQPILSLDGPADFGASGVDVAVMASRNYLGFLLENSKLVGGYRRDSAINETTGGLLLSELNYGAGLEAINSQINLKGQIDFYGNARGLDLLGTTVITENLCVDFTNTEALRAANSRVEFDSVVSPAQAGQASRAQFEFSKNGQHILLRNQSEVTFRRKNHLPAIYGNSFFLSSFGTITWDGANRNNLPGVSVEDQSTIELIHPKMVAHDSVVRNSADYGQILRAVNGSKASLFGTAAGCNFVWGPRTYNRQQFAAGLYAGRGSELNLHGPTVIAQYGIDALVEDNSVINIEPHRSRSGYGLEVSAFDLSAQANHTSVELHSTRACLVANRNSVINLQDLGSYTLHWPRTGRGGNLLAAGADYNLGSTGFASSGLTAYGSLQFFPNPSDSKIVTQNDLDDLISGGVAASVPDFPVFTAATDMNTFLVTDDPIGGSTDTATRGLASLGGVCLRAAGDSVVNVNNVHFPTGNNGGFMDGLFYDASGDNCHQLMIWNLADTSKLNASFLSVSGMYPGNSTYHGPSAMYVSSNTLGSNDTEYVAASGAPSSTPDTGTLSVLDPFGAGSAVGIWNLPVGATINSPFKRYHPITEAFNEATPSALAGAGVIVSANAAMPFGFDGSGSNTGPFRIYWSPKPSSKFLAVDLSGYQYGAWKGEYAGGDDFSGYTGPAYQIFSQGYNMSAPVSALLFDDGNSVSSVYPDLVKLSIDSDGDGSYDKLWTSGFYYCSEFLDDDPLQCMLDESASDAFQNAKNASTGTSGKPKRVTIYRSREDDSGDASPSNRGSEAYQGDRDHTVGFKSANIFDLRRDN